MCIDRRIREIYWYHQSSLMTLSTEQTSQFVWRLKNLGPDCYYEYPQHPQRIIWYNFDGLWIWILSKRLLIKPLMRYTFYGLIRHSISPEYVLFLQKYHYNLNSVGYYALLTCNKLKIDLKWSVFKRWQVFIDRYNAVWDPN